MTKAVEWTNTAFLEEVERRSGAPVGACLQCHKCSTGCPIAPEMDLLSSQVMRMVQLGLDEETLASKAIWLCASCEACTTRCPMEIDIAGVMDTLRMLAVERKAAAPDERVRTFNDSFLKSVRRHGRVFELGMMTAYKLRTRDFFSDVDKVPAMLAKRKLSFLPHHSSAAAKEVREAFKRADEEEKKR
ncbi:4Fe-4S dicluster domain-containing protein [Candidatus Sumerlaeota bacterium]|nr:4Fe-4S dicluster domain-containing protein [Candidatus Sumerlaeota bacterium]